MTIQIAVSLAEAPYSNLGRYKMFRLYTQKLTLTSPTNCGHSVGIVRSRTQATEFSFSLSLCNVSKEYSVSSFRFRVGILWETVWLQRQVARKLFDYGLRPGSTFRTSARRSELAVPLLLAC
jgi:hypothetical protein